MAICQSLEFARAQILYVCDDNDTIGIATYVGNATYLPYHALNFSIIFISSLICFVTSENAIYVHNENFFRIDGLVFEVGLAGSKFGLENVDFQSIPIDK